MALTEIPIELSSTPSIVDGGNATAITIDSSENVTFAGPILLTAGALAAAGNAGLSHRSADNKVYLQAGTGGFNILDDQQNTHFSIDSGGAATFSGSVAISNSSGDTLTLTKSTTEPSLRIEGDSNKDFVITVSGELLTFTQNDGATDILTLDHDTKAAVFAGNVTINTDANSSLSIADGGTNAIMIKAAAGDELYMGANNTYAIRILNDGTNNVVLDNGSNLVFASGHGIDFSASTNYGSSSSELLDDYEEGTWTPYLGTETQLGSPASTNYNNKYVKVGRLVKCTGWFNTFNYANVTSGTYMMIRNLPFPPEMHDTGMRFSYASNIGNSTYGYGHTALSAYYMLIGGTNGSPSHYNRSAAPTSGTAYSMITVTYYTAS